jgi:predicted MFS family arabinose efflux permease
MTLQVKSTPEKTVSLVFKVVLLSSLYTSQFLPSAFFFKALPIFMRQQGVSLQIIGLMGLLTLPWMLKFLWAPLIDRYGFRRWGHYKSWIIIFQILKVTAVIACASIDANNSVLLFQGIFIVVTFAATQDIATDALAVRLLAPHERGWGNGIQSAGRPIGGILGGGVMLLILDRLGWSVSLWILAAGVLLALLPLFWYQEPSRSMEDRERELKQSKGVRPAIGGYLDTLLSFVTRPGTQIWLVFILLYVTGSSMAATMFQPLLVDLGLSIADIGWMSGIVGSGAAIIGSLLAGALIQPLGRRRSLIGFGIVQAIAVLALTLPAMGLRDPVLLYAVSTGEVFARSLASTALFTVMMDKSRRETAGSDYTLQSSVFIVGHHIGIPALSGFIAAALGYTGVFLIGFGVCLVAVWLATKMIVQPSVPPGLKQS